MENTRHMKMTPVGLIPEEWDVATIKDYGHLLCGVQYASV